MAHTVVLLRHGHSDWNLTDRFTGWTDIALTGQGIAEAEAAGRRLAGAGFRFDEVHCSVLRRTRQTAEAVLATLGQTAIPIHETWRLNERHYGALQGLNKQEIFSAWGEQRARHWWRGYAEPPPALEPDDPRHPRFDPRYADLPPEQLPASESLADCQRRLLPYWNEVLAPRIRTGRRLLVVSHGNTLRGLVMHLDRISAEAMEKVEIAPGVPLVYRFSNGLAVLGREWLE
ncbi:2,3-bisphosphoglycerate-dependent phosphoglycerate mutase [Sulfuritortus calidifontis]|uniref:2,3-bisphosphoglycerate-dependent phosphoglycerate mutase n=1 Tax=Sulfuritortus calidifontis TaxID=1914471 RepID=A0A4R3JXE6_9PROT|nr:2,3-bisphosphoglycerate-dependent phosphoglycerate mutase [Sulfuritortus calidifontis]TCS72994.1 2,3-bisphosphoglycerate-dependent phosphoglycerate mutase [Sulfuritortus calidifontis]